MSGIRPIDIGRYLRELGAHESQGSKGTEWAVKCPFCGKAGHCYVNEWSGAWVCYRCGEKGLSILRLAAEIEGISRSAAFRRLQEIAARPGYDTRAAPPPEVPTYVDVPLPEEFTPVVDADGRVRLPLYLKERNITVETAAAFGLGFCTSGRYANRVILPIDCPRGRSFTSRLTLPGEPRYLAGQWAGRLLFGWHTIAGSDWCVVVEGPFDTLMTAQAQLPVVGQMGMTLRKSQEDMLRAAGIKRMVFLLDAGAYKAAVEAASKITWAEALVARLESGDPHSAGEDGIRAAVAAAASIGAARLSGVRAMVQGLVRARLGTGR